MTLKIFVSQPSRFPFKRSSADTENALSSCVPFGCHIEENIAVPHGESNSCQRFKKKKHLSSDRQGKSPAAFMFHVQLFFIFNTQHNKVSKILIYNSAESYAMSQRSRGTWQYKWVFSWSHQTARDRCIWRKNKYIEATDLPEFNEMVTSH